jgi:cytochrome c biogenesis protein CcdA
MEFYAPQTTGEWLTFISAAITVLFGLFCLLFPRMTLSILRLQTRPDSPEALSESRGTMAGFYLGVGIAMLLTAPQPLIAFALGAGWAFTAFGRAVSILLDRGFTWFNLISLLLEVALAAGPMLYVFGYVA